ncbi:uncharacterized protein [Leptinotarsa decemlineata]|uniref:uncharacterized protein n=1 Tax=Leptinotarsa decemlineata TaxID=7539 RepID=UPI003D30B058
MATNSLVLPEDDASFLKCSLCNGYLSVPPIKSSVDGTRYQCGRCDFLDPQINVRNFTYERVAKFMCFPCIYKGCEEKLPWTAVKDHELTCPSRTIRCPLESCGITVEACNTIEHFDECHPDTKVMNGVSKRYRLTVRPELTKPFLGMLVHDDKPYFCLIGNNEQKLRVSVYSVATCTDDKYQLILSTSLDRKVSVPGEKVMPYNDRVHCTQCYMRTCQLQTHKYSKCYSKLYEMTTELDLLSLKAILKSDSVFGTIIIEPNSYVDNMTIMKRALECPICKDYMSSPIYFCQTGHIICHKCKDKLFRCPSCEADFVVSRNYTVEDLSESLQLTCNNKECDFVGSVKALKLHEDSCKTKTAPSSRPFFSKRRIVRVRRKLYID